MPLCNTEWMIWLYTYKPESTGKHFTFFGKNIRAFWSVFAAQMIKLLGVEKGKKSRVSVIFVAGERVLKYLTSCYDREKKFTQMLKWVISPPCSQSQSGLIGHNFQFKCLSLCAFRNSGQLAKRRQRHSTWIEPQAVYCSCSGAVRHR